MLRNCWLASIVALCAAAPAVAQTPPTDLPLIPVPLPPTPPAPYAPAGPVGPYDHGYLYIPERAPEPERPEPPCGPFGRFWIGASLELADTPSARFAGVHFRPGTRAGLGLDGGLWLDPGHVAGVQASFYGLARETVEAFGVGYESRFATADVNYRQRLWCGDLLRVDGLAGYRYGGVKEELWAPRAEARAVNHFHGGQVGLAGEAGVGPWYAGATGTVAFGVVFTDYSLATVRRVAALSDSHYGVMPAVGVHVGRELGEHARAFVGYRYVGLTRTTRASDDPFDRSVYWAEGVSLGVELRY